MKECKWGVIERSGEIIAEFIYEDIGDFTNGFASVKHNGKWGFINSCGELCVAAIYDDVQDFSEGRAAVKLNEKIAFIDERGNQITDFIYDEYSPFKNGIASIKRNSKYGSIDLNGHEKINCIYDIPVEFSEGLAAVSIIDEHNPLNLTAIKYRNYSPKYLSGYLQNNKTVWIEPNGDKYNKESHELTSKNHKSGYINVDGEVAIPFLFDLAFPFKEGLACVCKENLFGYIDYTGTWKIENIHEDARDFSEGLAAVRKNGKWGYINNSGVLQIEFQYLEATEFLNGWAKVKINKSDYQFIDSSGNIINLGGLKFDDNFYKFTYFEHESFSENLIAASDTYSDLYFINTNGEKINNKPYKEAGPFKNGISNVVIEDNNGDLFEGFIDFKGKEYWENEIRVIIDADSITIKAFNRFGFYNSQVWALSNLDVTNFQNGDLIPQAQSDEEWEMFAERGEPAWCINPNNNLSTRNQKLYNWYAITDNRKIIPQGWRIPSTFDIDDLLSMLGGSDLRQSNRLRSYDFLKGSNESGFNAIPVGTRCGPPTIENWQFEGDQDEPITGWWLLSLEEKRDEAVALILYKNEIHFPWESKRHGLSVRLIRDLTNADDDLPF